MQKQSVQRVNARHEQFDDTAVCVEALDVGDGRPECERIEIPRFSTDPSSCRPRCNCNPECECVSKYCYNLP